MEDPRSSQIKQRSRPEEAEEPGCTRARERRLHSPERQRSAERQRSMERQHGSDPRRTAKAMGDADRQRSAKRMRSPAPRAHCRDPRRRSPERRQGRGPRNASDQRHSVDGRRSWPYDGPRDASGRRLSPERRQSPECGRSADLSPMRRVKEEPQAWDAAEQALRATFPTDPRRAARNRAAHAPEAEARIDRQAHACNRAAPAEPPAEDVSGRNEPLDQPGGPVPGWMQEMQGACER